MQWCHWVANFELVQVAPPVHQILNNVSGTTWWLNLQLMQVVHSDGYMFNYWDNSSYGSNAWVCCASTGKDSLAKFALTGQAVTSCNKLDTAFQTLSLPRQWRRWGDHWEDGRSRRPWRKMRLHWHRRRGRTAVHNLRYPDKWRWHLEVWVWQESTYWSWPCGGAKHNLQLHKWDLHQQWSCGCWNMDDQGEKHWRRPLGRSTVDQNLPCWRQELLWTERLFTYHCIVTAKGGYVKTDSCGLSCEPP